MGSLLLFLVLPKSKQKKKTKKQCAACELVAKSVTEKNTCAVAAGKGF
jgi:hypothetical protein